MFNSDAITSYNSNFTLDNPGTEANENTWLQPMGLVSPRYLRFQSSRTSKNEGREEPNHQDTKTTKSTKTRARALLQERAGRVALTCLARLGLSDEVQFEARLRWPPQLSCLLSSGFRRRDLAVLRQRRRRKSKPVTDIRVEDVLMTENGVPREVVKVDR